MASLLRPIYRSAAAAARQKAIVSPAVAGPSLLHARSVASSVTIIPASQTFKHAAQNIKEESGNIASDVAKVIAGRRDGVAAKGFLNITGSVASEVPTSAMLFGLAGTVPYVGAGATTVYLAHQAGLAAAGVAINMDPGVALTILDQALNVQQIYGAVILSFLGAIHWGMEFAGYGGHKGWKRLALGAMPLMFAWPTLTLQPMTALLVQWVGFTSLWWADAKATQHGWTPKWYSQYRFYLSVLVGTCIIGSLAGTSYYGPVAGHGFLSHDLDLIRDERKKLISEREGTVSGPIEAVPSKAGPDAFIMVKHKEEPEEGEGKEAADEE